MNVLLHGLAAPKQRWFAEHLRLHPQVRVFTTAPTAPCPGVFCASASLAEACDAHAIDLVVQHHPIMGGSPTRYRVASAARMTRSGLDELVSAIVSQKPSPVAQSRPDCAQSRPDCAQSRPDPTPSSVGPSAAEPRPQTASDPQHLCKPVFREMCLAALPAARGIALPRTLRKGLAREAVLVEFRWLPHLELLLRNAIRLLGEEWSYTVVCGLSNHAQAKAMCNAIHPDIRVVVLSVQEGSQG
jgi:hypothetical protein